MTPLARMAGAAVLSWIAVSLAAAPGTVNPELLLGMLGPLVSACATWIAIERAGRVGPERVTRVLVKGFAIKMVFFGAYLVVMLRVADLRPIPFVTGFTIYVIGLYTMEALFLKRFTVHHLSDH